jgi:nitric oxide reductase large subunit
VAHAARRVLDRDRVPRRRALPRAGDRRPRAEASSASASTCCSARWSSSSVGSLAGEWASIQQRGRSTGFWFGHQGYEYVDLGRFWQIALYVGLSCGSS